MATTKAKQWKKGKQFRRVELELPSGNVCLVRPIDPSDLLVNGTIPNKLLPLVQESITKAKKGPPKPDDQQKLVDSVMDDPEKQAQLVKLIDVITVAAVVEPPVAASPENEADRDEDQLYVDEVDFEDKIFIMNHAMGGTGDLEQFRRELEGDVVAGDSSGEVARPAKRPARNK